jgi:hypothetical protein
MYPLRHDQEDKYETCINEKCLCLCKQKYFNYNKSFHNISHLMICIRPNAPIGLWIYKNLTNFTVQHNGSLDRQLDYPSRRGQGGSHKLNISLFIASCHLHSTQPHLYWNALSCNQHLLLNSHYHRI